MFPDSISWSVAPMAQRSALDSEEDEGRLQPDYPSRWKANLGISATTLPGLVFLLPSLRYVSRTEPEPMSLGK